MNTGIQKAYKTLQTVAVVGLRLKTIKYVSVSYMNWNDRS